MSLPKTEMPFIHDETRIALLENNQSYINKSLERIENGISELKQDINKIDQKAIKLDEKLWTQFKWMIGSVTIPICTVSLIYMVKQVIAFLTSSD